MKKLRMILLISLVIAISLPSFAADRVVSKSRTDISLKNELEKAIGRGLSLMAAGQNSGGQWSQAEHPALVTAYAVITWEILHRGL